MYIFDLICVIVYVVSQLILVIRTLEDRWPLGDIIFGTALFTIGQVLLYGFGQTICDQLEHYLDATFCSSLPAFRLVKRIIELTALIAVFELCTLLAVMMVYKCTSDYISLVFVWRADSILRADWDSITKEDLEFSVGSKLGMWDVKEPLLDNAPEDEQSPGPHSQGFTPAGYPPAPPKQGYPGY